jgi:hypothetical protein
MLTANNMPIVDGTKLGPIREFGFGCLAGKAVLCPPDGEDRRFAYVRTGTNDRFLYARGQPLPVH